MSRSLTSVFSFLVCSAATAQEVYPPPGTWEATIDGYLVAGTISGVPFPFSNRDNDATLIEVGPCSDVLIIHDPEASLPMELGFNQFVGSTVHEGATIDVVLNPIDETRLEGDWIIDLPPHMLHWEVVVELQINAVLDPNAGQAEIFASEDREETQGAFTVADVAYGVGLWDFDVNSAELLPNHIAELDAAIDLLQGQNEPGSCQRPQYDLISFSTIYGYASQTGPERVNQSLAIGRANAAADYLRSRLGRDFFLFENSPMFPLGEPNTKNGNERPPIHAPGSELSCNRSLEFSFVIREKFIEMYSIEEAQLWLREWLAGIRNSVPANEQRIARQNAKANYVLAANYIEMVNDNHCDPYRESPAYVALNGSDNLKAAIESAYRIANRVENNPFVSGLTSEGGAGARKVNDALMESDPYYRYTFSTNNDARLHADEVDAEFFGEAMDWGCVEALPESFPMVCEGMRPEP